MPLLQLFEYSKLNIKKSHACWVDGVHPQMGYILKCMTLIKLQQYSKSDGNTCVSFKSFRKELTKDLTTENLTL